MDNSFLVSVLMTAYNREKYIAEAIESVLASTYTNFELIIVDDCSTDKTVEIARSYERKDCRVKVYVNEKNLGDYPNRNKAASYAKGKYLKYVDADDLIYSYGLELLAFYMEQFPGAGYGLCSLEQDIDKIFPFALSPRDAYRRHYFEQPLFHKAPLSSIIRKSVFEKVGGFTGKRMVGDFEMWHMLSQRHDVVLMPHGIVWYRSHGEQEMSDFADFYFDYQSVALNFLVHNKCPLSEEEKELAQKKCLKNQARCILKYFKTYGFKTALELKEKSNLSFVQLFINAFSKL